MTSPTLLHALDDPADPALRPLPGRVRRLLLALDAPPRLAAHLRAVHDVAYQLVTALAGSCPRLTVARPAVLFGAATHDIGKVVHRDELSGPGSAHEEAGYVLLRAHGVPEELARFARNHGSWTGPRLTTEDLLVSLADKVWKGRRVADLEDRVVERITEANGAPAWEAFMALDEILERLAADAERRLAYQSAYPIGGSAGS